MTHETAKKIGLDTVYPENSEWGDRIFYDTKEGKYYDAYSDLYLENFDPLTKTCNKVLDKNI